MAQDSPELVPGLNPVSTPLEPMACHGAVASITCTDPSNPEWESVKTGEKLSDKDLDYTELVLDFTPRAEKKVHNAEFPVPTVACIQRLNAPESMEISESEALDAVLEPLALDPHLLLDNSQLQTGCSKAEVRKNPELDVVSDIIEMSSNAGPTTSDPKVINAAIAQATTTKTSSLSSVQLSVSNFTSSVTAACLLQNNMFPDMRKRQRRRFIKRLTKELAQKCSDNPKSFSSNLVDSAPKPMKMQIQDNDVAISKIPHLADVEQINQEISCGQGTEKELPSKIITPKYTNNAINTRNSYNNIWIIVSRKTGVPMDENQGMILRKAIEKAQYNQSVENFANLPQFKYPPKLVNGKLYLATQQKYTCQWVTDKVKGFQNLWWCCDGFTVTFTHILHVVIISLPGFYKECPEALISFIANLNPHLALKKWPFYGHRVKKAFDGYDHILILGVPLSQHGAVRTPSFRLHYKLSSIPVKFIEYRNYMEVDFDKLLNEYMNQMKAQLG